jgi:hypothetical protein
MQILQQLAMTSLTLVLPKDLAGLAALDIEFLQKTSMTTP